MSFCDTSSILKIIMYIKYIVLFSIIITIIIYLYNNYKNKSNTFIKKYLITCIVLTIIYLILYFCFVNTNFEIKKCLKNSNPKYVDLIEKLNDIYNSNTIINTTDEYVQEMEPIDSNKIIGGKEIYNYNQNIFPLSNYEFTFNDSYDGFLMKKSGNELVTLASLVSTIIEEEEIDPPEILEILKDYDYDFSNGIDISKALEDLSNSYEFFYRLITPEEIIQGLQNNGLVMVKTTGKPNGTIFTCTDSYVLLYNYDTSSTISLLSSNDKDYDYICPVNTKGFGNVVKANINDSLYSYSDIINNSEIYYLIWR